MENEIKKIQDTEIEQVAGAAAGEEGFKIEVRYDICGKANPSAKEHYEMTYYVMPEETIQHIEERTWQHSLAEGANCETFYNGTLCAEGMTIRELGIRPYEILEMTVEAWGFGW